MQILLKDHNGSKKIINFKHVTKCLTYSGYMGVEFENNRSQQ